MEYAIVNKKRTLNFADICKNSKGVILMKTIQRISLIILSVIVMWSLIGCGGNTASVTQEGMKLQGPAMWLDKDNVFEIYEPTEESDASVQKYWTKLPYESHSKSMLNYYIEKHLLEEAEMTLIQQDEIEMEDQMCSMLFFTHLEAEVISETDYCLMLVFWELTMAEPRS